MRDTILDSALQNDAGRQTTFEMAKNVG